MSASVSAIIFPVLKSCAAYTDLTEMLEVEFCSVIYWALLMHSIVRGDLAHGYEFL